MRLGKEESRGFIDEPIEIAAVHDDQAAQRDSATNPRQGGEHVAGTQPPKAREDQPTSAR